MSGQLKFMVEQLNREPFWKHLSLVTFDSLEPTQLLQILNDVLAEIDPNQAPDIREETPEQTVRRMCALLGVLKYKVPGDLPGQSSFRQGLVTGSRAVVHPVLHWLLQRLPQLKKRAYLARFLCKIKVPAEFLCDDVLYDTYQQYEELVEEFKESHKECEQLRTSGFSTAEIRSDISAMEKEKDQLMKYVARLKVRVESVPDHQQMLEEARLLRVEMERAESLALQKEEQKHRLFEAEQRLLRSRQQLEGLRRAAAGVDPRSFMKRLVEDVKTNSRRISEKRKELESVRRTVQYLHKVVTEPEPSQAELQELKEKIRETESQINRLKRRSCPGSDKLTIFRQQAAIVTQRKESKAKELQEAREELAAVERKLRERRERAGLTHTAEVVGADELKRLAAKIHSKRRVCKENRREMAELRAERGVLQRTEEILKQRNEAVLQKLKTLEGEKRISGCSDLQEALEKASDTRRQLNKKNGRTLEDMSIMVKRLHAVIAEKKSALRPLLKQLKPLRQRHQEVQQEYEEKKALYERRAAGFETNFYLLEQEVKALREETEQRENLYHRLNSTSAIFERQRQRAAEETKAFESSDPRERRRTISRVYVKNISQQDALGKKLREELKTVREKHDEDMEQRALWSDLLQLMECKKQCFIQEQNQAAVGRVVQHGGKDLLLL